MKMRLDPGFESSVRRYETDHNYILHADTFSMSKAITNAKENLRLVNLNAQSA